MLAHPASTLTEGSHLTRSACGLGFRVSMPGPGRPGGAGLASRRIVGARAVRRLAARLSGGRQDTAAAAKRGSVVT